GIDVLEGHELFVFVDLRCRDLTRHDAAEQAVHEADYTDAVASTAFLASTTRSIPARSRWRATCTKPPRSQSRPTRAAWPNPTSMRRVPSEWRARAASGTSASMTSRPSVP